VGVFSFWKGKGVDAFVIQDASYLVEDLSRLNDPTAVLNQPQNAEVIKKLVNRQHDQPLSIAEVVLLDDEGADEYLENGIIPSLPNRDMQLDAYSTPAFKVKFFKELQGRTRPFLRLSGSRHRLSAQDRKETDIFKLLAYSSNASVILHYGDELNTFDSRSNKVDWDSTNSSNEGFAYVKNLNELRKTFDDGTEDEKKGFSYPVTEPNIFAFIRSAKYIGIVNFGNNEATITLSDLFENQDVKAKVLITTPNIADKYPPDTADFTAVELAGKSGILLEKTEV